MPPKPPLNNCPPELRRPILRVGGDVIEFKLCARACSKRVFGQTLDLIDHLHDVSKQRAIARDVSVQFMGQEIISEISQQPLAVRIFRCQIMEALIQPSYSVPGDRSTPSSPSFAVSLAGALDEGLGNFVSLKPPANHDKGNLLRCFQIARLVQHPDDYDDEFAEQRMLYDVECSGQRTPKLVSLFCLKSSLIEPPKNCVK